jgi:hypothetical protein
VTRYSDWVIRLEAFLAKNAKRKFAYGKWDCCLFVADAIQVMTGVDLAEDFRGAYDSLESAKAVIRSYSGGLLLGRAVERTAARFEMPECGPFYARRGDLALLRRDRAYCLGLVSLDGSSLAVAGAKTLLRAPLALAQRTWKV